MGVPDIFLPAPEPKTALGRHRLLSPTAGVRVSPLQLGGGSLGSAWTDLTGAMTKEASFKLLDAFVEAGGNFIDTANNYQNEESELFIGEWMAERKNRDRIILATKFTTNYRAYADGKNESINNSGNHKKSLHLSLRDSLKKLQTDYIDILYLHWWDWTTSIEEVMHSLDILVKQGKVLYLGISDTPAWIVAAANTYAREKGLAPFVVYQGRWNVMDRAFERDIIPMAHHFGMALAVWNAMAGGHLQTKKQLEERKKNNEALRFSFAGPEQTEEEERFSALLAKIAAEHNIESVTAVALAYVLSKTPYVFPIVGGRKVEHLHDNIQALSIKLTAEQIKEIEDAKSFDPGFPHDLVGGNSSFPGVDQAFLFKASGTLDLVKASAPL